ncbi:MAG TPA: hypothetical protein VGC18_09275 [Lacisediminihabitans sp.]|uniref:hypothetical protein n=1 Tax=Lacisediminihabitans sp. TaxID=2787631 RepID=UPI002EDB0C23
MLTELDPRVRASINLYAVLGSLPLLAERVGEARALLHPLSTPTALHVAVRGGPHGDITFSSEGVRIGRTDGAARVTIAFTSPEHFNRVIDGTAQPIPLAGVRGIRFLTSVFAPISAILGRYLQPSDDDRADPVFREDSTMLSLHVAAAAIAVVANEDRSGRFSSGLIPDGNVDLEVGESLRYQLRVREHRMTFESQPTQPPRAALRFQSLAVAGGILSGELSAMACICDGSLSMRGFIPMVDNVNRILDRVGHYLGK